MRLWSKILSLALVSRSGVGLQKEVEETVGTQAGCCQMLTVIFLNLLSGCDGAALLWSPPPPHPSFRFLFLAFIKKYLRGMKHRHHRDRVWDVFEHFIHVYSLLDALTCSCTLADSHVYTYLCTYLHYYKMLRLNISFLVKDYLNYSLPNNRLIY